MNTNVAADWKLTARERRGEPDTQITVMGPVPPDFTLEKLLGRQLNQICIGQYDLQFHFDSEHAISCSGRVVVELNGQATVVFHGETWGDVSCLPQIAGRDVTGWKIEASHEFSCRNQ